MRPQNSWNRPRKQETVLKKWEIVFKLSVAKTQNRPQKRWIRPQKMKSSSLFFSFQICPIFQITCFILHESHFSIFFFNMTLLFGVPPLWQHNSPKTDFYCGRIRRLCDDFPFFEDDFRFVEDDFSYFEGVFLEKKIFSDFWGRFPVFEDRVR